MKKENWVWQPHPGHLCVSRDCKFVLNTYVGKYLVSTVGEYLPDAPVREIFAQTRQKALEGMGDARIADYMKKIGYEELHAGGYLYETMVFKAMKATREDGLCCPWKQISGKDVETDVYKTAEEAFKGHMKMCAKWAKQS